MTDVKIQLVDATYDGAIIMNSSASQFSAIRIERSMVPIYAQDLNYPGIYFLLIGPDTVYVGQSGIDVIGKRIMNTHSGTIDSDWHTVLAFPCSRSSISTNELLFLENAMCEYAIKHYAKCATTTPSPKNCNASYRNSHYRLGGGSIKACNQYLKDIEHFISLFPNTIFPPLAATPTVSVPASVPAAPTVPVVQTELFYFINKKKDVSGKAEIEVNLGHTKKRKTILKAGSKVSANVSDAFDSSDTVRALRDQLEKAGQLVNRVLQIDLPFDSQSGALKFLNGTSLNGNECWKTVNGDKPLKQLL